MKVKPIAEIVSYLTPIAEAVGVEIVDAEWDMRAKSLTVFVDAEGGLDLVKCEAFHRAIDLPLDELDPTFGEPYTLNCSSPGLDRPFKTARDFERHLGEEVEVRLYAPHKGKKLFEGVLKSYDGESVVIALEGGEESFPVKAIAKICMAIKFN